VLPRSPSYTRSIVYFVLFWCGANPLNLQECDTMLIFVALTLWWGISEWVLHSTSVCTHRERSSRPFWRGTGYTTV